MSSGKTKPTVWPAFSEKAPKRMTRALRAAGSRALARRGARLINKKTSAKVLRLFNGYSSWTTWLLKVKIMISTADIVRAACHVIWTQGQVDRVPKFYSEDFTADDASTD